MERELTERELTEREPRSASRGARAFQASGTAGADARLKASRSYESADTLALLRNRRHRCEQ
jgi:hypothetical protein